MRSVHSTCFGFCSVNFSAFAVHHAKIVFSLKWFVGAKKVTQSCVEDRFICSRRHLINY